MVFACDNLRAEGRAAVEVRSVFPAALHSVGTRLRRFRAVELTASSRTFLNSHSSITNSAAYTTLRICRLRNHRRHCDCRKSKAAAAANHLEAQKIGSIGPPDIIRGSNKGHATLNAIFRGGKGLYQCFETGCVLPEMTAIKFAAVYFARALKESKA